MTRPDDGYVFRECAAEGCSSRAIDGERFCGACISETDKPLPARVRRCKTCFGTGMLPGGGACHVCDEDYGSVP